ncbi:MAG TPA: hypothetical protein VI546_00895 [candidate division Zixibacteria bacterium]|uniref:Uncharacterized protein n=1 Tax=Candidatus Doudnabacteria bacterium RIFCSPHIGHO2_01_52_17 TaxID=1817820 RepID=A0A1F5NES8_9BACT|nr:MAG: hypothetical protein A3K06_01115 [Candidatus Doudnabacteria bacterium RIFCSPHIGHO2_01_52_17]HLG93374.1 hypothetical protein [candidate division Zixibacteria bacterium]
MDSLRSHSAQIVITALGFAAAAILLIVFLVIPLLRDIAGTNQNIRAVYEELAEIRAESQSFQNLKTSFEQYAKERQTLAAMFPAREEMVSLVVNLENSMSGAATEGTLDLFDSTEEALRVGNRAGSQATPAEPAIAGLSGIEEVPFELQIGGSYRQILDFLFYIENSLAVTNFQKLSITADTEQVGSEGGLLNTGAGSGTLGGIFFIKQQ